jgi:hypothetical protein
VIVPHHYYIWNFTTRGSTLLPLDAWVNRLQGARWLDHVSVKLDRDSIKAQAGTVTCFGEHVAFDFKSSRAIG